MMTHDDGNAPPHPWAEPYVDPEEFEAFRDETRESLAALAEGFNDLAEKVRLLEVFRDLDSDTRDKVLQYVLLSTNILVGMKEKLNELETNQRDNPEVRD